jgi:hypothetical protein
VFELEPTEIDLEVQNAYQEFFREQVHYLLSQGYQLCRRALQAPQEEEEISDFLCRGILYFRCHKLLPSCIFINRTGADKIYPVVCVIKWAILLDSVDLVQA